ncbi:MAG TPA: type II toxin-antitoxin system HicA family toxin [Spirochaetes bacterium]|nr:type II toxin-antitoxin system HicA family toxin [Spirochaetota bacterium]
MSGKQRRLKAEEIIGILTTNGFKKVSQKGSHQKWKNYTTGKQVIVPFSPNLAAPPAKRKLLASTAYPWFWLNQGWSKPFAFV